MENKQYIKDIRKLKKKVHKEHTRNKALAARVAQLEQEFITLRENVMSELSWCKKYEGYYDD